FLPVSGRFRLHPVDSRADVQALGPVWRAGEGTMSGLGQKASGRLLDPVSLAIFGVAAVLPLIIRQQYWQGVLVVTLYYAIMAVAWNLLAGFCRAIHPGAGGLQLARRLHLGRAQFALRHLPGGGDPRRRGGRGLDGSALGPHRPTRRTSTSSATCRWSCPRGKCEGSSASMGRASPPCSRPSAASCGPNGATCA